MNELDKGPFYRFLNGNTSISEFEKFIYTNSILEQQLGYDTYFELINFDFKDKNSSVRVREYLLSNIIEMGEFETWKLETLIEEFLNDVQNLPGYLKKFYDLYCGVYQDNGGWTYKYRFLGNLGLNYFYWYDEDLLKLRYGDHWELAHENIAGDFEFYHKQLKPFGDIILKALKKGQILIHNDGSYTIEAKLKESLEPDRIFILKHP